MSLSPLTEALIEALEEDNRALKSRINDLHLLVRDLAYWAAKGGYPANAAAEALKSAGLLR